MSSIFARARTAVQAVAARPMVARVARLLSPLLAIGMVVLLVVQVRAIGWETIARVWPSSPLFYLLFAASYIGPILTEIAIYHRLWDVGIGSAPFFMRKRVMNEALLGYSGEAYAVWWAAGRGSGRWTPLQVVKDVNILSGIVSNFGTLALLAATLAMADGVKLASAAAAARGPAMLGAMAFLLVVTLFLTFKPRLFTLPVRQRAFHRRHAYAPPRHRRDDDDGAVERRAARPRPRTVADLGRVAELHRAAALPAAKGLAVCEHRHPRAWARWT